jgi:hypothetical protein
MASSPPGTRVAVFIDWQNAYRSARRCFGLDAMPNEFGNFSPFALARILAFGNHRGLGGTLAKVEVHRGLPTSAKDPVGHAACSRQEAAWKKESPLVLTRLRPLRYPYSWPTVPAGEKGIDVQLAVGMFESVIGGSCDVAILVSNDTDLLPAIESIVRLNGPQAVETAAWWSSAASPRLRPKLGTYHHNITKDVFDKIETRVNYAHVSAKTPKT